MCVTDLCVCPREGFYASAGLRAYEHVSIYMCVYTMCAYLFRRTRLRVLANVSVENTLIRVPPGIAQGTHTHKHTHVYKYRGGMGWDTDCRSRKVSREHINKEA